VNRGGRTWGNEKILYKVTINRSGAGENTSYWS